MTTDLDPEQYGRWEVPEEFTSREGSLYPFPIYEHRRKTDPVIYDETRGVWDVFTFEEVERVASDYEAFSSEGAGIFDQTFDDEDVSPVLVSADPPEHTRLRGLVDDFFYPQHLERWRGDLEERAVQLLDEAMADGPEFDFAEEVAWKFPMMIIADMLGIPQSKREQYKQWSDAMVETPEDLDATTRQEVFEHRIQNLREMAAFFEKMIEERNRNGGDDLMATLVETDLTDKETILFCQNLIVGGNKTTTMLLGNAIWTFVEEDIIPELQDGVIDLNDAIEEVLRYRSPVKSLTRKAANDVQLHGERIREGDVVKAWTGSANHDGMVFDAPEEFRVDRETKNHIAFGRGPHTCIGSNLAKMEARIMLEAFLDRIESAELTGTIEPFHSRVVYGLERLPIAVEPAT